MRPGAITNNDLRCSEICVHQYRLSGVFLLAMANFSSGLMEGPVLDFTRIITLMDYGDTKQTCQKMIEGSSLALNDSTMWLFLMGGAEGKFPRSKNSSILEHLTQAVFSGLGQVPYSYSHGGLLSRAHVQRDHRRRLGEP